MQKKHIKSRNSRICVFGPKKDFMKFENFSILFEKFEKYDLLFVSLGFGFGGGGIFRLLGQGPGPGP